MIQSNDKLLDFSQSEKVIESVNLHLKNEEEISVTVNSLWFCNQRWARNRAFETNDIRKVRVTVGAMRNGGGGVFISFNQIDSDSIRDACNLIRYEMDRNYSANFSRGMDMKFDMPTWDSKGISVWEDKTYNRKATENSDFVRSITEQAESQGLLSAGSMDCLGANFVGFTRDPWGIEDLERGQTTQAECSMTVRHPKGTGSGWCGASSFDLGRIRLDELGKIALEKCLMSIDPVRIEPGRYQTILEPQATAAFADLFVTLFQSRTLAERHGSPVYLGYDSEISRGRSKLGLNVADRRLSITHDPENPISGSHIYKGVEKVEFLKDGVLTSLAAGYAEYSLAKLSSTQQTLRRWSYEMRSSEVTSTDDMISNTKRGLLLTRVSGVEVIHEESVLYTGVTRDGLWLIENGKITKAVRNFRWTESPMFMFNNVQAVGESVPVMTSRHQGFPFVHGELQLASITQIVPTIQINDFSFTSTVDAI